MLLCSVFGAVTQCERQMVTKYISMYQENSCTAIVVENSMTVLFQLNKIYGLFFLLQTK